MPRLKAMPYRGRDHGSFEEEWGCHRKTSEWWYVTGYLADQQGDMYSYQYTLLRPYLLHINSCVNMMALTDFTTGEHYYSQYPSLFGRGARIDHTSVRFRDLASLVKTHESMRCTVRNQAFAFDLELGYGKGAFWHCDNGLLRMGLDEPKQTTVYYSYTNMPTTGTMTLGGETRTVEGKSWFDRQGGTYTIMDTRTHWEWFSLRFFDDEEMMLFTFPQSHHQDGTFVSQSGDSRRLVVYTITALDFITVNGNKFSNGWELSVPGVKDERYTIAPLMKGQLNLAYFEQLCGIYDPAGEKVGLCFVELLPGVYNPKIKNQMFSRVSAA